MKALLTSDGHWLPMVEEPDTLLVLGPHIGEYFIGWKPPADGRSELGMVDFSLFPHLDHEDMPDF